MFKKYAIKRNLQMHQIVYNIKMCLSHSQQCKALEEWCLSWDDSVTKQLETVVLKCNYQSPAEYTAFSYSQEFGLQGSAYLGPTPEDMSSNLLRKASNVYMSV